MKLPMLDLDMEVLSQDSDYFDASLYAIKEEVEGESTFPQDWWETATSDVDALIQGINEKLAAYDVSFTINDVLTSVVNTNIERQKAGCSTRRGGRMMQYGVDIFFESDILPQLAKHTGQVCASERRRCIANPEGR